MKPWNSLTWLGIIAIVATTILGSEWMSITLKRPAPVIMHRVDTLWFYHNDTVVTRAKDTVSVVLTKTGKLTEAHLVSLVCGSKYDSKAAFWHNPGFGFIICPNDRSTK